MKKVIIVESLLELLCVGRLVFPVSLGVSDNNMFLYFMRGAGINFVFVWMIMLGVSLAIHAFQMKKNVEVDMKFELIYVASILVTLFISII